VVALLQLRAISRICRVCIPDSWFTETTSRRDGESNRGSRRGIGSTRTNRRDGRGFGFVNLARNNFQVLHLGPELSIFIKFFFIVVVVVVWVSFESIQMDEESLPRVIVQD